PNFVKITSAEWRAWIKRGPGAARVIGSKTLTNVNTTKIIDLRKKEVPDEETIRQGPAAPQTELWRVEPERRRTVGDLDFLRYMNHRSQNGDGVQVEVCDAWAFPAGGANEINGRRSTRILPSSHRASSK